MTQEPASFGELSPAPMLGDAGLLKQSLSARDARVGNRGSKSKSDTSHEAQVVPGTSQTENPSHVARTAHGSLTEVGAAVH
jgi:hypothetical protein